MEHHFIGIDVGTQSVRVMAVTAGGDVAAAATHPLTSRRDGVRHEQDPEEWWRAVAAGLRQVMGQLGTGAEVGGIAVDATSGTILIADKQGAVLTPGLMYDDGRAIDEARLVNDIGGALWTQMSYRMQASWALPKLLWLCRSAALPARACMLHQNDWINWKLAGRKLAGDSSHALKTGYDLIRGQWPQDVLETLGIPGSLVPDIVRPGVAIGHVGAQTAAQTGLPAGIPIFAGMTDGCAAQIASGATRVGDWNTVIGTTLVVKGVTQELLHDPLGVVYSHRSPDGRWLPGGASSTGAAAIAAGFHSSGLDELNARASAEGPTQVVVYPLVSKGERFPFAVPEAEGFTIGEPQSVAERYRGVLQGIALWERLCFDTLTSLGADTQGRFFISGGAVKSDALNQMRADVLERELHVPAVTESAFGMALLAAAGTCSLTEATERMVRPGRVIAPRRAFAEYETQYDRLRQELTRRGWLSRTLQPAKDISIA